MLLRTILRSSSATYALPFILGFVLIPLDADLTTWLTAYYWPSATGSASLALRFFGPACAALGAWEGARFSRGRVFQQAPSRSPLAITVPVLLPILLVGGLGMAAALIFTATSAEVGFGFPNAGVLVVWLGLLMANTLVGFIVGNVLHPLIAVPIALLSSFFVNAFPISWDIAWLRHLVGGGLDGCCAIDQSLDGRALVSASIFALAVCIAAAVLIQHRSTKKSLMISLTVVVAGLGFGWFTGRDVGYEAAVDRPTRELVCEGSSPKVCLWPELNDRAGVVRSESAESIRRLKDAGIAVPQTLTMASRPGPGESKLGILSNVTADKVAAGVASGFLVSDPPECALQGDPYPGQAAYGPVAAWLYVVAGEDEKTVSGRYGEQETTIAQLVRKQSKNAQLDWYQRNSKALNSCGVQPQLSIDGRP